MNKRSSNLALGEFLCKNLKDATLAKVSRNGRFVIHTSLWLRADSISDLVRDHFSKLGVELVEKNTLDWEYGDEENRMWVTLTIVPRAMITGGIIPLRKIEH